MDDDQLKFWWTVARWVVVAALTLTGIGMYGCPWYNVYEQRMAGAARLAEANSSRQIAVVEAEAKMESASKLADAEIARARGVASANQIIGDSLKDNEVYLKYLWIQSLHDGKSDVIYVPTEANLPVLEAGRLSKRTAPAASAAP